MGGCTKLVIQDKKGKVYNLMPTNTQISEWFVNSEFDSPDEKIKNNYLKKILTGWEETKKEMLEKPNAYNRSLLAHCLNSAPAYYGICFVSFKYDILMNIQPGSSVNLVVNGKAQPKTEIPKLWSFKEHEANTILFHVRHTQWTVIESMNLDKKSKPMAKAIMESCGLVFNENENKLWAKFKY